MKKTFIRFAISLAVIVMVSATVAAHCQIPVSITQAAQSRIRPYSRERTEQWTLRSKAGRVFEISVSLPAASPPTQGFPVLYVTDPSASFATLAETVRSNDVLYGPAIVVGVGYTSDADMSNRTFDLTPAPSPGRKTWSPWSPYDQRTDPSGGADAFLSFLQEDLKPQIEKLYRIDIRHQALFGHSLGGLFTLHVLFTHPEYFDTYVASSPSTYYGKSYIFEELALFKVAQAKSNVHHRLLVTVGGLENTVTPEMKRYASLGHKVATDAEVRQIDMIGGCARVADELRSLSANGLEVAYTVFPDETHGSGIPAYLARGARFTLVGWNSEGEPDIQKK